MRILLVDNDTEHLDGLMQMLSKHDVEVGKPDGLSLPDAAQFEAIILVGSYSHTVAENPDFYASEMELVRSGDVPLLGIGLGFEIICYAFGNELAEIAEKIPGSGRISPTADGARIFQGSDPILVSENLRWCVEELPKSLVRLATSETGIEAIRHKSLPVYGLQFLPEDFTYLSDGKLVFDNILQSFGR